MTAAFLTIRCDQTPPVPWAWKNTSAATSPCVGACLEDHIRLLLAVGLILTVSVISTVLLIFAEIRLIHLPNYKLPCVKQLAKNIVPTLAVRLYNHQPNSEINRIRST